jgi:hypothetical protein
LDKLDNLDTGLLIGRWDAVCIGFVHVIPGMLNWVKWAMTHDLSSIHERMMTQHHPYEQGGVTTWHLPTDRTRVAQINSQRVTIWKNVCLLFWSRGANHSEGAGSRVMLMDGVKAVCVVCAN